MPSTAFDNHPYPNPSAFMPSRPEWVLGPPSNSDLAQRRRSVTSTTSSPSPPPPYSHPQHHHHRKLHPHDIKYTQNPHRPRVHDHRSPRHRSPSYERSRSRQPRSRQRSASISRRDSSSPERKVHASKNFEAGYAEKNGLALTPLYAPKYADKSNWTLQRRQAQARAELQHQQYQTQYYAAHSRRRHHKAYYSDNDTDSDAWSSDSESDNDHKTGKKGSANWKADEDWPAAQKKKRNARLLTTGLAVVSTIACANNLYQNRKGFMERREERAKAGGGAEKGTGKGMGKAEMEEAKQLRQKHLARDVIGLAVAGVCVNNARKGWNRVRALEK